LPIPKKPIPRLRDYSGPAIFSYGFRPFFFFGSIHAALAVMVWLPVFHGHFDLVTAFAPRDWHVHEMLFGFAAAVVTGFLLTAIPNWTGRLPLQGRPLAILFAIWVAGRVAILASAEIGWTAAMVVDAVFLVLVAAAAAREIVAGHKWSNLKVVAIVSLLALANIAFHLEAHFSGIAEYSSRGGIAFVVTLIMLIGGRIVPSFTRNWLARRAPGPMPVPFNRFDAAVVAISVAALLIWIVAPIGKLSAMMLFAAGGLQVVRLARWAGYRTASDRLVLILHVAYAFVPVGFLLSGLGALELILPSAGIHAWTGGAIGSMTLAVMSRASLGHTGRTLAASLPTQFVYAAVVVAAVARICAAVLPDHMMTFLPVAGFAWVIAFAGFATVYAKVLCAPRQV
jgi:uncharacterized protein involved in response to NO